MHFSSLKSKHQLSQLAVVTCIAGSLVLCSVFLVKKLREGGSELGVVCCYRHSGFVSSETRQEGEAESCCPGARVRCAWLG